jgi:hypothetical protein
LIKPASSGECYRAPIMLPLNVPYAYSNARDFHEGDYTCDHIRAVQSQDEVDPVLLRQIGPRLFSWNVS